MTRRTGRLKCYRKGGSQGALLQERAKYAEELEAMPSAREAKDAEAQAAVEVAGLEQKVTLMQAELHEVQVSMSACVSQPHSTLAARFASMACLYMSTGA